MTTSTRTTTKTLTKPAVKIYSPAIMPSADMPAAWYDDFGQAVNEAAPN